MVNRDVLTRKIASATAYLRDVDELIDRPLEEFRTDLRGRDLTAFYLQLAIQDCIDVASHWVSQAGWPPPDDAASGFQALADHGVISSELASIMRDAVGLRHRIAHGYATINHQRLYDEARAGCPQLKRFLALIADAAQL